MNRKIVKIAMILLVMVAVLTACANGGESDKSNSDGTTLTFWNRLPELTTYFDSFINQFEEEHPEITIKMETLGASGNQQYQTAIKNQELPDLFVTANVTSVKNLVEQDLLRNLNEIFTADVKSEFYPGVWSENFTTIGDDVYQMPLNSGKSSVLMYYNNDVLENYGISEDQVPTTWDELEEIGKQIYSESNGSVHGLIMGAESTWLSDMAINQMATNITPEVHPSIDLARQINYKTGEPDFVTDGNIETINYLKKLYDDDVLSPSSIEYDEPTALANFAAGRSAFFFGGNWTGSNLVNSETGPGFENWGVSAMPTKDGEAYYSDMLAKEGIMVSNHTEHWEEVKIFIEYFIENGFEAVVSQSGAHEPPIDSEISEPPFEQLNELNRVNGENSIAVPDIYKNNDNTIEFIQEYQGALSYSVGSIFAGYLQGEITDLTVELEKAQTEAQGAFDDALSKYEDVEQSDFQFDDWVPGEPYITK